MKAFNLTAELTLSGPTNLAETARSIKAGLKDVTVKVRIDTDSAIGNIELLQKSINVLRFNLNEVKSDAIEATAAIAGMAAATKNVQTIGGGVNKSFLGLSNVVKLSKQAKEEISSFGHVAGLSLRRFIGFGVAATSVYKLVDSISAGVSEAIEFDTQMVRLSQVTKTSVSDLSSLDKLITGLSKNLGVSSTELTKVSLTLAQAGFSGDRLNKALSAIAKTKLLPTFDDVENTTEGLISAVAQFQIPARDFEKTIGSINRLSADFAVESDDLVGAITRAGSVFSTLGGDTDSATKKLNEFLAVYTTIRATTRANPEQIATGLRTVAARLGRRSTLNVLDKDFGIQLTDAQGKFIGLTKAIGVLQREFAKLNDLDPRKIAAIEELGGYRQLQNVIPLLNGQATTVKALASAEAGAGSIAEDVGKAQEALSNKISKVREEFLALIRDVSKTDTFKIVIESGLKFASTLIKVADSLKELVPLITTFAAFKGFQAFNSFGSGFIKGTLGKPNFPNLGLPANLPGVNVLSSQANDLSLGISGKAAPRITNRIIESKEQASVLASAIAKNFERQFNVTGLQDVAKRLSFIKFANPTQFGNYNATNKRVDIEIGKSTIAALIHEFGHAVDNELGYRYTGDKEAFLSRVPTSKSNEYATKQAGRVRRAVSKLTSNQDYINYRTNPEEIVANKLFTDFAESRSGQKSIAGALLVDVYKKIPGKVGPELFDKLGKYIPGFAQKLNRQILEEIEAGASVQDVLYKNRKSVAGSFTLAGGLTNIWERVNKRIEAATANVAAKARPKKAEKAVEPVITPETTPVPASTIISNTISKRQIAKKPLAGQQPIVISPAKTEELFGVVGQQPKIQKIGEYGFQKENPNLVRFSGGTIDLNDKNAVIKAYEKGRKDATFFTKQNREVIQRAREYIKQIERTGFLPQRPVPDTAAVPLSLAGSAASPIISQTSTPLSGGVSRKIDNRSPIRITTPAEQREKQRAAKRIQDAIDIENRKSFIEEEVRQNALDKLSTDRGRRRFYYETGNDARRRAIIDYTGRVGFGGRRTTLGSRLLRSAGSLGGRLGRGLGESLGGNGLNALFAAQLATSAAQSHGLISNRTAGGLQSAGLAATGGLLLGGPAGAAVAGLGAPLGYFSGKGSAIIDEQRVKAEESAAKSVEAFGDALDNINKSSFLADFERAANLNTKALNDQLAQFRSEQRGSLLTGLDNSGSLGQSTAGGLGIFFDEAKANGYGSAIGKAITETIIEHPILSSQVLGSIPGLSNLVGGRIRKFILDVQKENGGLNTFDAKKVRERQGNIFSAEQITALKANQKIAADTYIEKLLKDVDNGRNTESFFLTSDFKKSLVPLALQSVSSEEDAKKVAGLLSKGYDPAKKEFDYTRLSNDELTDFATRAKSVIDPLRENRIALNNLQKAAKDAAKPVEDLSVRLKNIGDRLSAISDSVSADTSNRLDQLNEVVNGTFRIAGGNEPNVFKNIAGFSREEITGQINAIRSVLSSQPGFNGDQFNEIANLTQAFKTLEDELPRAFLRSQNEPKLDNFTSPQQYFEDFITKGAFRDFPKIIQEELLANAKNAFGTGDTEAQGINKQARADEILRGLTSKIAEQGPEIFAQIRDVLTKSLDEYRQVVNQYIDIQKDINAKAARFGRDNFQFQNIRKELLGGSLTLEERLKPIDEQQRRLIDDNRVGNNPVDIAENIRRLLDVRSYLESQRNAAAKSGDIEKVFEFNDKLAANSIALDGNTKALDNLAENNEKLAEIQSELAKATEQQKAQREDFAGLLTSTPQQLLQRRKEDLSLQAILEGQKVNPLVLQNEDFLKGTSNALNRLQNFLTPEEFEKTKQKYLQNLAAARGFDINQKFGGKDSARNVIEGNTKRQRVLDEQLTEEQKRVNQARQQQLDLQRENAAKLRTFGQETVIGETINGVNRAFGPGNPANKPVLAPTAPLGQPVQPGAALTVPLTPNRPAQPAQPAGENFGRDVGVLNTGFNNFSSSVDKLVSSVNKINIPTTITAKIQLAPVVVQINGTQAFENMKPEIAAMVNEGIKKAFNGRFNTDGSQRTEYVTQG